MLTKEFPELSINLADVPELVSLKNGEEICLKVDGKKLGDHIHAGKNVEHMVDIQITSIELEKEEDEEEEKEEE